MKKIKSALSLFLCFLLVFSAAVIPVGAEEVYPESEHYQNNYYDEWTYTHPEGAIGLFVTFSVDTYTEEGQWYNIYFEPEGDVSLGDVIEEGENYKQGDYISIFTSDGTLLDVYQGSDLTGKTIFIPDSSFKISYTTDSFVTSYGFKIENITSELPEDTSIIRYHMPDGKVISETSSDYSIHTNNDYNYYIGNGESVIGWILPNGNEFYFDDEYVSAYFENKNTVYDLYSITTPVSLNPEEVYSFTNDPTYFLIDDEQSYYLTKKDHLRLIASVCMIGCFSPLAIPASVLAAVLVQYPYFDNWNGSCIGFANTVCLQKKGILDVVSTQEGATCVRDLQPTSDLISLINYYNSQASATIVPKNKAVTPGSEEYKRQMKKLVETVKAGELVLLEYTLLEEGELVNDYHGVVVTGTYTLPDGRIILLVYDENSERYSNGLAEKITLAPDYSYLDTHNGVFPPDQTGYMWTSDFDCYKAVDINNDYPEGIFVYWIEIIKHIIEILKEWFDYYGLENGLKIK